MTEFNFEYHTTSRAGFKSSDYTNINFLKAIDAQEKRKLPVFHAFVNHNTSRTVMCIADIDELSGYESFDEMALDMADRFGSKAFVMRSPSGKVKVIFKGNAAGISKDDMRTSIWTFLQQEFADLPNIKLDKAGINQIFLDRYNFSMLTHAWDNILPTHTIPLMKASCVEESSDGFYRLIEYKGTLPKTMLSFIGVGRDAANREKLVRILVATWNLIESFDLPVKLLANQVGVSPATISRYKGELISRNLLECINSSYIVGVKAKTYRARWMLAATIKELKAKAEKKTTTSNFRLPTCVTPGRFYNDMLGSMWKFSTLEAFMSWVMTLEGIDSNRIAKARNWARYHYANVENRVVRDGSC